MKSEKAKNLEEKGWTKFRAIVAHQPGGDIYQISISGRELAKKHTVLRRGLDEEGIQRIKRPGRCKRIAKFYAEPNALLPCNIIGSVPSEHCYVEEDHVYLSPELIAEIIDGQHRLGGFEDKYNKEDINFEIFFAFLIDADTSLRAKQFYKINREQKKINPSLAFDLLSVFNPKNRDQAIAELIKRLNKDDTGPFYDLVKVTEKDTGIVSLANMVTVVKDYLKTTTGSGFELDDSEIAEDELFIVFKNYFSAIKELFPTQWGNTDSILSKTLGMGALSMVMNDVLDEHVRKNGWTLPRKQQLSEILEPVQSIDFEDEDIKAFGGKKGQTLLANKIRDELGFGRFVVEA